MKKAFAFLITLFFAKGAFAAIELAASTYVTPQNVQSVEFDSGTSDCYALLPVGFEVKSTFFFGNLHLVNLGLNIGLSGDSFGFWKNGGDFYEIDGGWNATFVCGPALSVNFSRVSLFVSPGFQASVSAVHLYENGETADIHSVDVAFDLGAHIDAGCRVWFLRRETFALGMNFGADYAIGGGKYGKYTLDESDGRRISDTLFDMPVVHRLKIYTGISFCFGK